MTELSERLMRLDLSQAQKEMIAEISKRLGTDARDMHQCLHCDEWIADGEEPDGCRDPSCPELGTR